MIKTLKNKVLIISVFLLLVCVGLLVNYTFFKPTKLNYFVASKIYKAPANSAFTDDNFYKCVVSTYNKKNGTSIAYTENLTDEQLKKITSLTCTSGEIYSATGIEKLTNLKSLTLDGNKIETLDLSGNLLLTSISVANNYSSNKYYLKDIDVSKNVDLVRLYLDHNQLTNIDLSNNTKLQYVNVRFNKLTELNVSNIKELLSLDVTGNELTELDLSDNTSLISLKAYKNQLININLSGLTSLNELDVSDNKLTELDLSNSKSLVELNASSNELQYIDVVNHKLLTNINLRGNKLKKLDVSNNINLDALFIEYNQLENLNINGCVNLTKLRAYQNNLQSLDTSTNINLITIDTTVNQLTSLDLSKNLSLTKLHVDANQLTSLDLSKNLNLIELDVSSNQLTSLDLSKNINLTDLDVSDNLFIKNIGMYVNDEYVIDEYDNTYLILPDTIKSKFKWVTHISGISRDNNIISSNKSGKYITSVQYEHDCDNLINYYDIVYNIYVIETTSDKYEINAEEGYIYTKTDTDSEIILSNINLNYGEPSIEDNKLLIKYDGELIKSFDIVNISSDKYDLSKDFIYIGPYDLDASAINTTNATLEQTENSLKIKYNDIVLQEYPVITFDSDIHEVTDKYIHAKNGSIGSTDFNSNYELRLDGSWSSEGSYTVIKYGGEEIARLLQIRYWSKQYDLKQDYIYTGTSEFDLNKINSDGGFDISIQDNKLIIGYEDEILREINIYNLDFRELNLKNKRIVILEEMTYEEFVSNITTNGVTYKIYNSEEEVTTGNVTSGMKLKVYIGEELVDTYEITDEYLEISDNLNVNETTSMIEDLTVGQTVEDIKVNIDTTGNVKVINQGNMEVIDDIIGTGYKVVIELSKETIEYTLVVSGDITGDGEIKMSDVMKAASQMIEENTIVGDCYLKAADVTGDGKIKMSDVMKLANMILEGEI